MRLVEDNDDTADDAAEQGCRLAALVLDLDAARTETATTPPVTMAAITALVDHLDGRCVDLDAALNVTADPPPVPLHSIAALVEYLDEPEHGDYRATAAAERPGHIYRHVAAVRRWVRKGGGRP